MCYLPYIGVGSAVLGYLGGYGDEQQYKSGGGFFLVSLLRALGMPSLDGTVFAVVSAAVLALVAVMVVTRAKGQETAPALFIVLAASFLLLISPHYAWYFAWVLPLLARAPYVPLLYVTLASFILYLPPIKDFDDFLTAGLWLYGGFAALAVADAAMRLRHSPIRRPA